MSESKGVSESYDDQISYKVELDHEGTWCAYIQVPTGEEIKLDFVSVKGPWGHLAEEIRYNVDGLTGDSIVVDAGAYLGEYSEKIASKCECKIYAYEPVEEYYNKIVDMVNTNPSMKNVMPFKVALSTKTGKENIVISDEGSALEKYNKALSGTNEVIDTVDVVDELDWIMSENEKEEIDLMKINVEGAEFDLFHNLITSGMLPKIKNMHVQFHAFAENSYIKYLAIKQEMSKTHDVVLDSLWKWTFWTRKDSND